jgi:hypothetical protein
MAMTTALKILCRQCSPFSGLMRCPKPTFQYQKSAWARAASDPIISDMDMVITPRGIYLIFPITYNG